MIWRSQYSSTMLLSLFWLALFLAVARTNSFVMASQSLNISLIALFLLGAIFPFMLLATDKWFGDKCFVSMLPVHKNAITLVGLLVPLLMFWVLFHQVLGGWWTVDDPDILHHSNMVGIWRGFYDPESRYNFYTPLQVFSLGIDLSIAEFNPAFFYWHHLLSLSLTICLLYLLLNHFFAPGLSCMAVSLFVVAVPTSEMAHWLMLRHYVEGLLFSLCSILLFIKSIREERWQWAVIGSLCYFVSTLAKELYVPLVIVLPFLPIGSLYLRAKHLIPYVGLAVLYTGLRFYMLKDQLLIGYAGQTIQWQYILNFPQNLLKAMGWTSPGQLLVLAIVLGLMVFLFVRLHKTTRRSLAVWLGVCFAPLIPILGRIADLPYYLYVFILGFSVLCVFSLQQLLMFIRNKQLGALITTGLFLLLLLTNLYPSVLKQQQLYNNMVVQKIQGQMLFADGDPDTVLIYDYHVADDLVYFRDLDEASNPSEKTRINWCPRNDCLCAVLYPDQVALKFVNSKWEEGELGGPECSNSDAQLAVTISIQLPQTLSWEFEVTPQLPGVYSIASTMDQYGESLDVPYVLSVPNAATVEFCCEPFRQPFNWMVHFKSSEGWELTSAPIVIDSSSVDETGKAVFTPKN
jgi:hypothetical protein